MRYFTSLFLYLGLCAILAAEPSHPIGVRSLDIPDIEAVVWYPSARDEPATLVADNPVFVGVRVVKGAPVLAGTHPVALLSHGYSGLWRNQAWLAARLAQAGYLAVSLNHPGTTFGDMDPSWATRLAERPRQLSRVLDALLADDDLASRTDPARIAVIGHSLGGWTALALAGGVFDPARLQDACGNSTDKMVCTVFRNGGMTKQTAVPDGRDDRISAAVLLDMEGIHGFTPGSLRELSIPTLALAAGIGDPALPLGWESRAQAKLLPAATSRYAEVIGATHFSFMSECKPGAEEILKEDAFICQGETAPRAKLHEEIASTVIRFLNAGNRLASALQSP
ncbi:alpha/beta hydrolase family protein [Zobellella sp. DQSA1]|uniref:alpha/beta hydrolase family protein n=1 Tax=Zobellella sp. DQSA1 TaxID=3342386 RepID=UPI0035BF32FB